MRRLPAIICFALVAISGMIERAELDIWIAMDSALQDAQCFDDFENMSLTSRSQILETDIKMSSLSRRACYKCGNVGHYAEVCSSSERLCYNCKQPGESRLQLMPK